MEEQLKTLPRKSPQYYIDLESTYGAKNYLPLPVVLQRAEGVWVWDVEGKKYLDCLSAYSAVNQGHRHPKIIAALIDQLSSLTLTSRAFYNNMLGPFLKKLCEYTGMEIALPMNTGAEAVETAIKIARRWGYRKKGVEANKAEIIVCDQNFHGRTTTIVGFSSDENSISDFGPYPSGFVRIPFNNPEALEKAINPNTVGFLVEPLQGEAGVKIPTEGYLKTIAEICRNHNILLMLDEIQTGFCRTGKKFAFQYEIDRPDILMVGKALGGGVYPISAALTRKEIMDVITPGSHGSTFGGNPVACAVGMAALEILESEKLADRAKIMGERFLNQLREIKSEKIKEIRGMGLLLAIECWPEFGKVRPLLKKLAEKGILAKDTHDYTIRFAPPLIIDEATVDWAVNIINETFLEEN